ncbi:NADPH-dependent FMN reductase [Kitasatospora viridis]|uniref:NAD(P)H-dependent FMN reductase n=1 Tax=Kitasatospora viridis TaxID=281105 RepID=A0A561UI66_9ACTN|nr:NAD(P)H-dependent oxidoreductase [Kitasatospora viridis]TWF99063.1 NAD(P)H-dependent FMN reductase [Kitasatospora viridis]
MPANATTNAAATTGSAEQDRPLRVAVIVASVREGRLGPRVTEWFLETAASQAGMEYDVIDLAEVELPLVMPGWGAEPSAATAAVLAELTPRLADADAFVVVTPEYNHSFPAALKNLVDWFRAEWQAKPVGFVSYGGLGGGLRAVEQLRLVFAELHAVTMRDSVSLHAHWSGLTAEGVPADTAVSEGAVKGMLGQLDWWGRVLRSARVATPYAG